MIVDCYCEVRGVGGGRLMDVLAPVQGCNGGTDDCAYWLVAVCSAALLTLVGTAGNLIASHSYIVPLTLKPGYSPHEDVLRLQPDYKSKPTGSGSLISPSGVRLTSCLKVRTTSHAKSRSKVHSSRIRS